MSCASLRIAMKTRMFNTTIKQTGSAILLLVIFFLLFFFRNPRIFIYPEPWAEDMGVFIGEEFTIGFPETAFRFYAGYIHLLPRIITWFAMKFDMPSVMRIMNWLVLFIKLWTVYLIYSAKEIKSVYIKFSLVAYLILLPFSDEIYNNVTNLQWWLIPLMAVILVRNETYFFVFIFNIFLLVLSSLTGVNSVIFAFPCLYLICKIRTINCFIKCSIVLICACVQFYFLYKTGRMGGGRLIYSGGGLDIIHLFVTRGIYHSLFNFDPKIYLNYIVFILYVSILVFTIYFYRKCVLANFMFLLFTMYVISIFYNFFKIEPDFNLFMSGFAHERYFVNLRICSFMLLVSFLEIVLRFLLKDKYYKRVMAYSCFLLCVILFKNYTIYFPFVYQYYDDIEQYESAKTGEIVKVHYAPNWWRGSIDLLKK